ncbi:BTB/POZ/MATH-domain protein [Rhynchospora pubera]|uniref:BTB/POZ/MATH-domain protein n=1 Tax=Rhynchospora pubera TaxID=906938 RepID=A0AAV8EH58_9POAL|nr:BTB/POZ/MATH-domain protein [Rhynchospora pubera]
MATKLSTAVRPENLETIASKLVESRKGSYLFKAVGYSSRKEKGSNHYFCSEIFTIGGYKWIIRCYPGRSCVTSTNDDKIAFFMGVRSKHVKDFVKITLTMLAQDGKASLNYHLGTETAADFKMLGWHLIFYIRRETLETPQFLKHDSFTLRCTIEVMKEVRLVDTKMQCSEVPPSNLSHQLSSLLESADGADVSFNVDGSTIHAHKFMLAARSPVFKAQFFGPMKLGDEKNTSIQVDDMDALIFYAILHFIYSDSLPELYYQERGYTMPLVARAQHLLVAADRYGIERLKKICELKLYEFIAVDNLATTLTLAEQHNCSELKAACMEFVKDPKILAAVVLTEDFEHMIKSYPTVLKELRQKIHDNSLQEKWFIGRFSPEVFLFSFIIDAIGRFIRSFWKRIVSW